MLKFFLLAYGVIFQSIAWSSSLEHRHKNHLSQNNQANINANKSIYSLNQSCIDHSDDFLEEKLSRYLTDYSSKWVDLLLLNDFFNSTNETQIENHFSENKYSKEKCYVAINALNCHSPNQLSICPWENVVKYRSDRYPHYIEESACQCKECNGGEVKNKLSKLDLSSGVYGCRPVFSLSPVLVKGKCMADGYFEWKPELEMISEACFCGYKFKYSEC